MWSAKFNLSLLDRGVRSAEMLRGGEFCCLGHRRRVSALCLLYKINHRKDNPSHEYLIYFVVQLVILELPLPWVG